MAVLDGPTGNDGVSAGGDLPHGLDPGIRGSRRKNFYPAYRGYLVRENPWLQLQARQHSVAP